MFRMAFRNIFRQRRRSLLTLLTMLGGFVLAAFSIGWADGSYNEVINAFTRNRLGHIQLHYKDYLDKPSIYKTIDRLPEVNAVLASTPGVESWAPRVYGYGLGAVGDKTSGVRIVGIDPVKENETTAFNKKVIKGRAFSSAKTKEVILGQGLADLLKTGPGGDFVVVSQAADGSLANEQYKVVGIANSGDEMSDRMDAYLRIPDAWDLLALTGRVHEIAITVPHLNQVSTVAAAIRKNLHRPDIQVAPWQKFAAEFYRAMKADKGGNWITLGIILLIVAVGVLNTVLMSVLERRREYGVLLALGTPPVRLFLLIVIEAGLLAMASIILGTIIGVGLNSWVAGHGIHLSEPFQYGGITFKVLRTEVNVKSFVVPGLTVLLTSILVALFPGIMASHTEPARAMRMH